MAHLVSKAHNKHLETIIFKRSESPCTQRFQDVVFGTILIFLLGQFNTQD